MPEAQDRSSPSSSSPRLLLVTVTLLACGAGYWLWSGSDGDDETPAGDERAGSSARGRAGDGSGLQPKKLGFGRDEVLVAERAALSGAVRDPEGSPIAGAQVCASARSRKLLRREVRSPFCTTTGADGAYRLDGLFPVKHRVSASAPEYKPGEYSHGEGPRKRQTVPLMIGVERRGVDIVLKPGGVEIFGTVRDISGGVLEGAQVRSTGAMTRSDEEGRFSLWVGPGVAWVNASAEGYTNSSDRGAAPGHDFELLLTPESVLIGKVVLAGTQTPVAGISVDASTWGARSNWGYGPAAITDASGTFRIDGLDPGIYKPTAFDDEHYGIAAAQVQLGLGETSDTVLVEVHPAFAVTGSIVPDDGELCDEGSLTLNDPQSQRRFSGRTESDGEVHLQGVLPGTYEVDVDCQGYVPEETYEPLTVKEATSGLRFSVVGGQTIRGQVLTAAGEPAAEMRVRSTMKTDAANPRARQTSSWGQKTEDDGSFAVYGLKPGTHELTISGELPGPDEPVEVVVPEGSDVDGIKVELPAAGSVKGRVVDERGEPVGDVQIRLRSKERGGNFFTFGQSSTSTRARDDGTFELEHVRPGAYRATASQGWSNALRNPGTTDDDPQGVELSVDQGETAEIELRVEAKGASIRGRVVDADGGPVTDAFLSATRESDSATKSTGSNVRQSRWGDWDRRPVLTDQDGTFTLDDLTVGTYTVRARRKGGGEGFVEGVSTDSEVTVTLDETGSLAGLIVVAGGSPPEEFQVSLSDRESGYRRNDTFFRTGGEFSFEEVPGGTYEVSVNAGEGTASTKVPLEEGEERGDLKLELVAQVTVRGRLVDLDSGEPVAGIEVHVSPRSGGNIRFGQGGGERKQVSDANGEFEIAHAPSGEVQIMAMPQSWGGSEDYDWTMLARTLPAEPKVQDVGTIELIKKRVVDTERAGDLGYSLRDPEPDEDRTKRVLKVGHIRPGGPAAKTGLKVGDVITSVNGHDVRGEQCYRYSGLATVKVEGTLTLGLASGASIKVVAGPPL